MKLYVGQSAPDFTLPSHLDKDVKLSDYLGRNVVLVFYPKAWTPIWTGQIPSYEADAGKFAGLDAQVLGVSIDHVPCLQAWAESLGGINYPLMSDFWPHGEVAKLYGVFREKEGDSERAIFVIDKRGFIRYIDIHDVDHQPDNDVVLEVLRRVDPEAALRSPAPPPINPEEIRLPHGGIVMYCTRWCPGCRRARAWFQSNNIEYIEVDIDVTPGAADQVKKWANGYRTTPTFDIEGTILVGYDEKKVDEAIREKIKR